MIDVEVFIVELIGECFAFGVFYLLHLCISTMIEVQLSLPLVPDLSQFFQVVFVGAE